MRSLLRASTVTHLRIFLLQTVTAGMAENTRGDIVEMSRYIFYIFMQGYCLLHRPSQGSVGNTRELETSEKRERGMMGTSVERELFLPFSLLPSSPPAFPKKSTQNIPQKLIASDWGRGYKYFSSFLRNDVVCMRRCANAVQAFSSGVFFFWFPLTRFWLLTLTHVNFNHVNKIEAR